MKDLVYLASIVIGKDMDFETFKDSDYCYLDPDLAEAVWVYVEECKEIGTIAFHNKYKDHQIYPI